MKASFNKFLIEFKKQNTILEPFPLSEIFGVYLQQEANGPLVFKLLDEQLTYCSEFSIEH